MRLHDLGEGKTQGKKSCSLRLADRSSFKDLVYTRGGLHDAAMVIEAESHEPMNTFTSSVQSLGNVKMKFVGVSSIDEMRKMV